MYILVNGLGIPTSFYHWLCMKLAILSATKTDSICNRKAHNISKVVHGQSESKDVGIIVVGIDVLSVGQPDEVPLQLLPLGPIALPMLGLPQVPFLNELELNFSCSQSKASKQDSYVLHLVRLVVGLIWG